MSERTRRGDFQAVFEPGTIAVMGASSNQGSIGWRTMRFLEGFSGQVCTVGRGADFERVDDVPFPIDQLVMNLPPDEVEAAMAEAAAAGVRSVVLYSGGFADAGETGRPAQERLSGICRSSGMRLLGPNSAGVVNVRRGAFSTYSHTIDYARPRAGSIALVTQSGAVGTFALARGVSRGLGFSRFVATGNEADVDVVACIDWLVDDPETAVVLLYLESTDDGPGLVAAMRRARSAGKPVIVLKGGASETGAAAAASHTGKLAGADIVFSAAFRQAGACRVGSIDEMLDLAYLCSCAGLPRCRKLTVLSGSGGIGVMMADAAAAAGLSLPPLSAEKRDAIRRLIPQAGVVNPVDTTGAILNDFSLLTATLDIVLSDQVDGATGIFLATVGVDQRIAPDLVQALEAAKRAHPGRLLVTCMIASPEVQARLERAGIPVFDEPTRLVSALAHGAQLEPWHERSVSVGTQDAAEPQPETLPDPPWSEHTARTILEHRGIPFPPGRLARNAPEAEEAAKLIGGAVAMKVVSPDILHKSDMGGVALNVGPEAVAEAFEALVEQVSERASGARLDGISVTAMVDGGVETVIGTRLDPNFGPILLFGLGGVHVELFNDVAVRLAPITTAEAFEMIDSIRGAKLLAGYRSSPAVDRDAIANVLVEMARFAVEQWETVESVEINPFLAQERGGYALDALLLPKRRS